MVKEPSLVDQGIAKEKKKNHAFPIYLTSELTSSFPVKDFPGGSDGKESPCNGGDQGSIPGLRRSPGEGKGYLLQHSSLENPRDRGAWGGYKPWGRKESDMTD